MGVMWHTVGAVILLGVMVFAIAYPFWMLGTGGFDEKPAGTTVKSPQTAQPERKPIISDGVKKPTVTSVTRSIVQAEELEKRIHDLVNDERRKHGISELGYDERVADVARKHSRDMAENDYFSHVNSNNMSPFERYEKAGLNCIYKGGENIHLSMKIVKNEAYFVVDGWMKSALHRQNILDERYTSEGIGVYVRDDGAAYTTQNFC